jgi:hypothetical protein
MASKATFNFILDSFFFKFLYFFVLIYFLSYYYCTGGTL